MQIALISITIVGVGGLLGRLSWGMVLIVAIGCALVLGAEGVVEAIAPETAVRLSDIC